MERIETLFKRISQLWASEGPWTPSEDASRRRRYRIEESCGQHRQIPSISQRRFAVSPNLNSLASISEARFAVSQKLDSHRHHPMLINRPATVYHKTSKKYFISIAYVNCGPRSVAQSLRSIHRSQAVTHLSNNFDSQSNISQHRFSSIAQLQMFEISPNVDSLASISEA
jgi:hypothetical protein